MCKSQFIVYNPLGYFIGPEFHFKYSKTCVKRQKIGFQDQFSLNAGQKYCRMLQGEHLEHSAILSTSIKLPFVIKIFVMSIFEWLFNTGFTVKLATMDPPSKLTFNCRWWVDSGPRDCMLAGYTLCLLVYSADKLCKQYGTNLRSF